jgi:hypothetical protein
MSDEGITKCGYVWLFPKGDRHVCDRIAGHSGPHRCEVCDAAAVNEPKSLHE